MVAKPFPPLRFILSHCEANVEEARYFRTTITSGLKVHRCPKCSGVSNLHSGTIFAHKRFRPTQVVLFVQGLSKGTTTSQLACELKIGRQTVHYGRQTLQASAQILQPDDVLPDTATETDEMFQNAGEKGEPHLDPKDPSRRLGE